MKNINLKRLIYNGDNNILAFFSPSPNWAGTLEELGTKVIPKGKKYKIIEHTELPTDRTFRDAWEIDEEELTDGVGGKEI